MWNTDQPVRPWNPFETKKQTRKRRNNVEFILDRFLARRQVNIIGGASGAGKTTLIFQLMKASGEGGMFMGMPVPKLNWAYISGDRTAESVEETQKRIGFKFPIFSLVDKILVGADLMKKILPMLPSFMGEQLLGPGQQLRPDVVYIDGFTSLCPDSDMNNYGGVSKWLAALQRYCVRQNLTILGAAHATKVKEGERIMDPRQRIIGSTAWAGYSEDVIIIDNLYKKDDEGARMIHLLPRNGAERSIRATFEGGYLVPDLSEDPKVSASEFTLEPLLTPGARFMGIDMEQAAKKKGVSRATYYRWLNKLVKTGRLMKGNKGEYIVLAGEGKSILNENDPSKPAEESCDTGASTQDTRTGDPSETRVQREKRISSEVQGLLENLQRRRNDASSAEVRGTDDEGAIPYGVGIGGVHSSEGEDTTVEEDPFIRDSVADHFEDDLGSGRRSTES